LSKDWVDDVIEFHDYICYPVRTKPTTENSPKSRTRSEYMMEEVEEYAEAMYDRDIVEMADGLADLIYFAIGTALYHGIDLRTVMDEVHKSNMTKTPDSQNYKNCVKGPDFKKPNIVKALREGKVRRV